MIGLAKLVFSGTRLGVPIEAERDDIWSKSRNRIEKRLAHNANYQFWAKLPVFVNAMSAHDCLGNSASARDIGEPAFLPSPASRPRTS